MNEYDAPNQQAVRADGSGPGVDMQAGTPRGGGSGAVPAPPPAVDPAQPDDPDEETTLDEMSKEELLEYAQSIGVSPANKNMTKDELRAAVEGRA